MEEVTLKYKKLTSKASTPVRGSAKAAGIDLCSAYEYTVPAKGKCLIKTDLQVSCISFICLHYRFQSLHIQLELPVGCYGRIAPRSGLSLNHFIHVGAGVIDEDYRGNVGILLFNFSEDDFKVESFT